MNTSSSSKRTRAIVGTAALTAIVIILQFIGSAIRFGPFSISLVLIPIVIGAALFGVAAGAWLGLVFGIVVLISGDAASFLAVNVPGTILTVLVKGVLAGLVAGLVYRAFEGKNRFLATVLAAVCCPIVNTGVFVIFCNIFFMPTITGWAEAAGFASAGKFIIIGMVGVNFLVELLVNVVLSPVIIRIIRAVDRRS